MKLLHVDYLNKDEHEDIKEVLDFLETHDLADYEGANNEVSDTTFFNVAKYTTGDPAHAAWESHKRYIDVHVAISGTERIHHNFLSNLETGDYDEAGDSLDSKGPHKSELVVSKGDILVFYPEDAHQTGIIAHEAENIHKAIFKVKL